MEHGAQRGKDGGQGRGVGAERMNGLQPPVGKQLNAPRNTAGGHGQGRAGQGRAGHARIYVQR